MPALAHDFSFMSQPDWKVWEHQIQHSFGDVSTIAGMTVNKHMIDQVFHEATDNITNIFHVKTKQGYSFHERLSKKTWDNKDAVSEAYGSIYKYGTKSDILTPKQGLPYLSNAKDMAHANEYEYLSNITPHTLSEGGHLNLDLLVKDGVVYNVPKMNVGEFKNGKHTNLTYVSKRAGIIMNKDGSPEAVSNIGVDDYSFIKLKVKSGSSTWDAREYKNVAAFDDEFVDKNITVLNQEVRHLNTTIENMQPGETRVITEFYESQKETLDLTGLKAYEVEATEVNNISTTKNFLGGKMIMQAPYVAHITNDVSGNTSYKTPLGTSLIVHKDGPSDVMNLSVGDPVETEYQLQDKTNPLAAKIKAAKWAISSIDYGGARMRYPEIGPDKNYTENDINTFPEDQSIAMTVGATERWVTNASWAMRNGICNNISPASYLPQTMVPRAYFVIDRVNKTYGVVHFDQNDYARMLSFNNYVVYLRSLGFTDAIALDGGGSSYAYKRVAENYELFPSSVDGGGIRVMTSALAIGDIYE